MLIAQTSDLHIRPPGMLVGGVVDTAAALEACVAHLQALPLRPDLLLITGDLTQQGRPEEYAHLRRLLAPLGLPLLVCPGNHDDRAASGQGHRPSSPARRAAGVAAAKPLMSPSIWDRCG
ncbi:metallophosphoesterase [Rhodospirillum rubrum]|uniref:metallophosphoesterase n=1 Tax=Rhodospirillum rubrum TaxID=1085 RepID=UPI001F5B86C4|nr:metallophosphoesterase [Rhodospirillum rubrum]